MCAVVYTSACVLPPCQCICLTCWGCVSWSRRRQAPSAARRSQERKPGWCSAGGAHAERGTGPGSAWLLVHSGATPAAVMAGLPKKDIKFGNVGLERCTESHLNSSARPASLTYPS